MKPSTLPRAFLSSSASVTKPSPECEGLKSVHDIKAGLSKLGIGSLYDLCEAWTIFLVVLSQLTHPLQAYTFPQIAHRTATSVTKQDILCSVVLKTRVSHEMVGRVTKERNHNRKEQRDAVVLKVRHKQPYLCPRTPCQGRTLSCYSVMEKGKED